MDLKSAKRFLGAISMEARYSLRWIRLYSIAYVPMYYARGTLSGRQRGILKEAEREWEDVCDKLSVLPNLHTIEVTIFDNGFRIPERKLLERLARVHAEDFVLVLPWPLSCPNTLGQDDGMPFKIHRATHCPPEYRGSVNGRRCQRGARLLFI